MIEYKLQIVCKKHNYIVTEEYDEMCDYSDNEIVTKLLKKAKDTIGNDNIYTIIVWRDFK